MLSEKELMVLDILKDKKHICDAEKELKAVGLSLDSTYKIMQRLQKKGSGWMTGVNQILGWRRSSKPFHSLLDKRLQFHS